MPVAKSEHSHTWQPVFTFLKEFKEGQGLHVCAGCGSLRMRVNEWIGKLYDGRAVEVQYIYEPTSRVEL